MDLLKYEIVCDTEAMPKYVWLESGDAAPTQCPTDTSHTVTQAPSVVNKKSETIIKSQPYMGAEGTPRPFGSNPIFSVAAGTTQVLTLAFPFAARIKGGELYANLAASGDVVELVELWNPGTQSAVKTYGSDLPVRPDGTLKILAQVLSEVIPAGLELRIHYKSAGVADVGVSVWVDAYE